MPYIEKSQRKQIDNDIEKLAQSINTLVEELNSPNSLAGILNYTITKLILKTIKEKSYSNINSMIGVVECVKQEFYRRYAAPYEDVKTLMNGDVYNEI